jgi:hypothetical protein
MANLKKKPGRPRKSDALDAAARMRASRGRKRRAGFRLQQRWVADAPLIYSNHQILDARSLALHCLIARKIFAKPALISKAKQTLTRWKENASDPPPPYFLEWQRILKKRPPEIAGFLASMQEDATRLRHSSPFTAILTRQERSSICEAFR